MKPKTYLITGGAGFVGSYLAIRLKENFPDVRVIALDNLKRRGSELNLPRLRRFGVEFVHADIRNPEDLAFLPEMDCLIDCAAEPSVLAGQNHPEYIVQANLMGTLHCLELARKNRADFVFLSTSRVYPLDILNQIRLEEQETRFNISKEQPFAGVSPEGIAEDFPLIGPRSFYGATKFAVEQFILEYSYAYSLPAVINRCGIITGPGQMGKVDQGVVVLWLARHFYQKPLSYIGYGGKGKQVRDVLHVEDLFRLLLKQLPNIKSLNNQIFNVGGGKKNSVSLQELTELCQQVTGQKIAISSQTQPRPGDVPIYISDCRKIQEALCWKPNFSVIQTLQDIFHWLQSNSKQLEAILL